MKRLYDFITESYKDDILKLSDIDKKKLIELDNKFNVVLIEYEHEHVHFACVQNTKEEIDNILNNVKSGNDYKINLKYEDNKFSDNKWVNDMLKKLETLLNDFISLDCYLTKFYVHRIEKTIESIKFLSQYTKDKTMPTLVKRPSEKLYNTALETIKNNPYIDIKELAKKNKDYERVNTPEVSQKRLQKIIDKLGYGWNVIIDDNMIPRMSVTAYKEFRISKHNKFSEIDLQSLEVHEIEVHTARKYYALQTGLFLFLYGLRGSNIYDEGMAIYNSLNKLKNPKPNILFYICIKVIILYNMCNMNTFELFTFVKNITHAPDKVVALAIIRESRVFSYCEYYRSPTDEDYLDGYERVKNMTADEREELLHYNIGPDQLYELDTIKKFFKINKFEPLEFDLSDASSNNENNEDNY